MDTTHKYRLDQKFMLKQVGDDLLAFDPTTLEVHELNSSVAAVARLCDGERSCEGIVVEFAKLFELSIEQAALETYRALNMLQDKKLINAT